MDMCVGVEGEVCTGGIVKVLEKELGLFSTLVSTLCISAAPAFSACSQPALC